jgi:hypothetical protein
MSGDLKTAAAIPVPVAQHISCWSTSPEHDLPRELTRSDGQECDQSVLDPQRSAPDNPAPPC